MKVRPFGIKDLVIVISVALVWLAGQLLMKKYRIVYVDNRNLTEHMSYNARQAAKLAAAGIKRGWSIAKTIAFSGDKLCFVVYILRK